MNNYTGEMLSTNFNAIDSQTGEFLGKGKVEKASKFHLAAQGYRRVYMQKDGVYEKFMKSLSSGLEIAIAVDFMRDINKDGTLKYDMAHYQKLHETSRPTVSKVFTKAKQFGLFKAAGRTLFVNPYVVLPYQSKDEQNHYLQRQWDALWYASSQTKDGKLTKAMADEVILELSKEFLKL